MIITQTPLRVSFFGGGSDFPSYYRRYGGAVLSTAINKYVYCIIKERFDEKIYVNYSKKEIVDSPDELKHELVREALKKVGIDKGIEISFLADIPAAGAGLGSSSSVTVGTLNALYHYIGYTPDAEKLAREACDIEINILKKPIGIQDQYIAAYGGLRFFRFSRSGKVFSEKLDLIPGLLKDFESQFMLFFTGKTRRAETILQEQKSNIDQRYKILRKMTKICFKSRKILKRGDINKIGILLRESWELKKKMASKISNSAIDKMYRCAIEAGAVGGKITGAGGGGFMLLFVPYEKRPAVRKALKNFREMPFGFERDGSKVIFNMGRYY